MNPYEARCRQLLTNGVSAWAGDGFARAKIRQEKTFHWLDTHNYLPTPGVPVLELGCGNNAMAARYLAERDYAVSDVDVSETAIRQVKDRFQQAGLNATFSVGNVCHLSQCEDAQFTLIVDSSCLHCLLEDERRRFFAEVRRLLKPASRLVIGSMCGFPRCTGGLTTYDPVKHHLLRGGQLWHTFKPLPALLNGIQQAQLSVFATDVKRNAR